MKRVILVSLNFPPSTIASVHRARHLAKHLPSHGWEPVVLAVDERFHKERPDPGLAQLVPADIQVVRIGALPYKWSRFLGIGDLALRSIIHLKPQLALLCELHKPDVVLFTGWPYYQMLLSKWVRSRYGASVILDFQDPWVSAHGALRPKLSKGGIVHQLAALLEPIAVRSASWITSVSQLQNADLAARYPWFDVLRMSAIPIGGDPEDYASLRASKEVHCAVPLEQDRFNICYVGTYWPRAEPVLRMLFKGVARFILNNPKLAAKIRFVFVGTSNQPPSAVGLRHTCSVLPIAAQEGIASCVIEYPERIPYLEALTVTSRSDAVLMFGSDEPHYNPSKLFPTLMSGRPWIAIYHEESAGFRTLYRASGGIAIPYRGREHGQDTTQQVERALAALIEEPKSLGTVDPAVYADFTANAVARQFAAAFEASLK